MLQIKSVALTHPGLRRSKNEDFVSSNEPRDQATLQDSGVLYIVADGVGGASRGEYASRYATERVEELYYQQPDLDPGQRLRTAFRQAGNEIYDYAERSNIHQRMATTMVAGVILGDQLIVASVGDSRAYLLRGGKAWQITEDDTEVAEMVRNGMLTEEEAQTSKIKNRLSRSLGGETDVLVNVYPPIPLKAGDRILFCTDGLTRFTTAQDLVALLGQGSIAEASQGAIDYANQSGGVDNVSVILVSVGTAAEGEAVAVGPVAVAAAGVSDTDLEDTIPWGRRSEQPPAPPPPPPPPPSGIQTIFDQLRPYSLILTIGITLTCVAAIVGIVLGRNLFAGPAATSTPATPGAIGAMSAIPTPNSTQTAQYWQTATQEKVQGDIFAQNSTSTANALLSETQTAGTQIPQASQPPLLTETNPVQTSPAPEPTNTLEGSITCVVEVEENRNNTLDEIFNNFGINYDIGGEYYKYLSCEEVNRGVNCDPEKRSMIEWDGQNAKLNPNEWLIIPEPQTPERCEEEGGKILIVQ